MKGKAYKKPNMRPIVISAPRVRAWWPADAPAIVPKGVKVQVGPRFPDPTQSNTYWKT